MEVGGVWAVLFVCLQRKLLRSALRTVINATRLIESILAAITNHGVWRSDATAIVRQLNRLLRDEDKRVDTGLIPLIDDINSRIPSRHRVPPPGDVRPISDYVQRCSGNIDLDDVYDIRRLSLGLMRSTRHALVRVAYRLVRLLQLRRQPTVQ